jgi:large subunit ribosomal protein L24
MANRNIHLKKNDVVFIIAGKEQGKKGKVLKIFPEKQRIIVEHLNFIKRHTKPNASNRQGGIVEKEGSIHISNALLFCNQCDQGVRIGKKILEDGTKVRYCKKCGELMDK